MYEQILQKMQQAARTGRVRFRSHAIDELSNDNLSTDDAINCILTGEIVEDQFDVDFQQLKYVIFGEAINSDEMCVVVRWDDYQNVIVITAYRLRIADYD